MQYLESNPIRSTLGPFEAFQDDLPRSELVRDQIVVVIPNHSLHDASQSFEWAFNPSIKNRFPLLKEGANTLGEFICLAGSDYQRLFELQLGLEEG